MSIKVTNDANNGTVTIKGAEVAGDYVVTTPAFATELAPRMVLMTARNSTSGTSIDFTGIPSWAKKITVMFSGVSTSGNANIRIQLGTGSTTFATSGYIGGVGYGSTFANVTNGIDLSPSSASSDTRQGLITIVNINSNTWTASGVIAFAGGATITGSYISLGSVLTGIRVTTVNGTDTFDAGKINVLYEG